MNTVLRYKCEEKEQESALIGSSILVLDKGRSLGVLVKDSNNTYSELLHTMFEDFVWHKEIVVPQLTYINLYDIESFNIVKPLVDIEGNKVTTLTFVKAIIYK